MGRVKPTQSENQVVDLGSDPHLWAYIASTGADSAPWLYDPLFPMESESFPQIEQRTIYNNSYPWYGNADFDINSLKAMQELPLQQQSVWGESDGASPNSQPYISDSRDSSPCISTNPPSESGTHRINMGENFPDFPGFRDEFKALPLLEQQKILSSEGVSSKLDLPRKIELHEIFIDNVSRIKARIFEPESGKTSTEAPKPENSKPTNNQGDKGELRNSSGEEQEGDKEADAGKKSSRRGLLPSEEMPFSCSSCGVGCRDKTSLRKHMYVHQPRRYFCDFNGCNIGFHTRRDLRRHTDTKHRKLATGVVGSRVRRKSFICKIPACERGKAKPFSRRDNARQHVVGVHGIKNTRGEAEKVIEEIDIDIEGEGAVDLVEESNSLTVQRAEPKKSSDMSTKPTSTTERAPIPGQKTTSSKESEDVLAEFTNLQEIRHDNSVTKPNSSSQTVQTPRKKPSASEPRDARPPADSRPSSTPAESDEQSKLLLQQQLMSSLIALGQPDTPQPDLDIWEQMAKAQADGTAPPIDPASIFDIDMVMGFAKMHI